MDLWVLYSLMKRSRVFEEAITSLWEDGLISGEMHLGTGEEAIIAGTVSQLGPGDSMAVDHRSTAPFLMRGVDPKLLLFEFLGDEKGLCGGKGGHMHLYAKEFLAASSGIVGSSGPTGAGFALAAQYKNTKGVTLAFFGEGAVNQGMLMESLNLAAVWNLPILFICKDDDWSITTKTQFFTGGSLKDRVEGLGLRYDEVDGLDVVQVWKTARQAIHLARTGKGPSFIRARCIHLEGHFLGLQTLRLVRNPLRELPRILGPLMKSFLSPGGGSLAVRLAGIKIVLSSIIHVLRDPRRRTSNDPLVRIREHFKTNKDKLEELDRMIESEIRSVTTSVLNERIK